MNTAFEVTRPITVRCVNPNGVRAQLSVGDIIYQRKDGIYEADRCSTASVIPAVVDIQTIVFEINPFIAATDLEAIA
ncbi:MAG: hypothetical protein AAGF94_18080 [Pseudomonadota bacterium]